MNTDIDLNKKSLNTNNIMYMLRTAQQHHVQLSLMADQKASFLIAASFVVLSILAGYIAEGRLSILIIFVACILLIAAIFAILAIMPRHRYRHKFDVNGNILFFGNFSQLSYEDYLEKMLEKISSDENIYEAMIHDIYSMGKILNDKKYRFLSISYRIFFLGLFICPFVALIEYFYFT